MPLMKGSSKKAFKHNVEAEMKSGKPQDQSLAIAYSVKRKKPKKMAEGGSVKDQKRPMPEDRHNDAKEVAHNSGNKAPKNDQWTDNPTIKQAQANDSRRPLAIKHPKMVPQSLYSVRLRDEEDDLQSSASPGPYGAQPPKHDDEVDAKKQGNDVPDMASQHNNGKKPYNKAIEDQYSEDVAEADMKRASSYAQGGPVMEPKDHGIELMEREDEAHLMDREAPSEDEGESEAHSLNEEDPDRQGPDVPALHMKRMAEGGELEMDHEDSIAAAIMAKKKHGAQDSDSDEDSMVMAADGGILSHDSIYSDDSDQADLSRNADEDANEEDQLSFNALRKENYSESEGLRQLDSPEDSNEHGDAREDAESDDHDKIDKMRSRMNMRRQFKQR